MISSLIVFLPSFKFIALTFFQKKKLYQQFNSIKFELVDVKNEYLRINFWNFYFFCFFFTRMIILLIGVLHPSQVFNLLH